MTLAPRGIVKTQGLANTWPCPSGSVMVKAKTRLSM